ncbi:hypothetical protein Tco_0771401 [Tanacetum coccineum]|uniref:Reverse transcriptase domain-containing protein n=1 Tax=Tanacetum coccineum TaxID=301880 RepID=A0ABQ4ZIA5_9ASTR
MNDNKWINDVMIESRNELFKTIQSLFGMFREQESTIPLNEIISQLPQSIAITPVLPTMEPEDSLIMRDEDLRTIPEKESDEFIKSSVEDLVPIPSKSEDMTDSDSECDLPFYDNSVTLSNPLFDANDDFTSSDDESLPEEDVQEENFKIYSNPLFEFNEEYISSDVNPLFNEVLKDIESKDSYVFNLDEPTLLVTPFSDANEDECFDPRGDIDEIDAFLNIDVSTDIEDGYHDLEGDIIYLESLLINNTIPNLPPEVTNISKMDKNKAKMDKTEHEIGRARDNEAEGIFIFNGPTRKLISPHMLPSLLEGQRGASDITAGHVGNPKHSYWLQRRGEDPRAMMMDLEIKGRD